MIARLDHLVDQLIHFFSRNNRGREEKFKTDFKRYKTDISKETDKRIGLFRSFFIKKDGLAEIILFETFFACSIKFNGVNEALNCMTMHTDFKNLITVGTEDGTRFTIKSNHLFFVKHSDPKSLLKRWIYSKAVSFDPWGVSIVDGSEIEEFDRDHLRHVKFLNLNLANELSPNVSDSSSNTDIEEIVLDRTNTQVIYDIDDISGTVSSKITGFIKKPIRLAYSSSSRAAPVNRKKLFQIGTLYYNIRNLHCCSLGCIELSSNEKINFYFVLGMARNSEDAE